MPIVTLSAKGQIVLPRPIRDALGLREGDRVNVTLKEDHLILSPLSTSSHKDWRHWRGCLAGTQALKEHLAEHADEVRRERVP